MPMTSEQVARQQTEGSLRRRFDHFITRLPGGSLAVLADKWDSVESMLEAVLAAGAADSPHRAPDHPLGCVTRPVRDKNGDGYHEEPC